MYKIEDVQIQDLGKVGEITITKDDCLLMKVNVSVYYSNRNITLPNVLPIHNFFVLFHIPCLNF